MDYLTTLSSNLTDTDRAVFQACESGEFTITQLVNRTHASERSIRYSITKLLASGILRELPEKAGRAKKYSSIGYIPLPENELPIVRFTVYQNATKKNVSIGDLALAYIELINSKEPTRGMIAAEWVLKLPSLLCILANKFNEEEISLNDLMEQLVLLKEITDTSIITVENTLSSLKQLASDDRLWTSQIRNLTASPDYIDPEKLSELLRALDN